MVNPPKQGLFQSKQGYCVDIIHGTPFPATPSCACDTCRMQLGTARTERWCFRNHARTRETLAWQMGPRWVIKKGWFVGGLVVFGGANLRSFWGDEKGFLLTLAGGFNPFEKYQSNWIISPGKGENKKCLKPPPSTTLALVWLQIVQKPLRKNPLLVMLWCLYISWVQHISYIILSWRWLVSSWGKLQCPSRTLC